MENVRLVKPDDETAIMYDYFLLGNSGWKQAYLRLCEIYGDQVIPQGELSDWDYYRLVMKRKFDYYLLVNDDVIGGAEIFRSGENAVDIQYLVIEEEYRGMGYGTIFFQLLEDVLFKDEKCEIYIEDMSMDGVTTKIAIKLGYEQLPTGQYYKSVGSMKKYHVTR